MCSACFFVFWVIDGLNSYLHFLTGKLNFYAPSNFLRLMTGMVSGLSFSLLIFPVFNFTLWRQPNQQRVVNGFRELTVLLLQVIGLERLLWANVEALLYPLIFLDFLSVLCALTIVNSILVMILLRWENRAEHWVQALPPLSLGLLLSIGEVSGLAVLRHLLVPALLQTRTEAALSISFSTLSSFSFCDILIAGRQ